MNSYHFKKIKTYDLILYDCKLCGHRHILGFWHQIKWSHYCAGLLIAATQLCEKCQAPFVYAATAYPVSLCEQEDCAEEYCKACHDILVSQSNEID